MDLSEIHSRLAATFILFMAIASAWSFLAGARRQGVSGSGWGIYAIGELLALVVGALGIALYVAGERPARSVHLLYGVIAVLTLPAYYAISKGRDDRTASLVYGGLFLFLAIAGYRAVITGA